MHFFYLVCVFLLFQLYGAQQIKDYGVTSDCQVEGINETEWNQQKVFDVVIKDTDVNTIVFQSAYENIESVGSCDRYFCIKLDEDKKLFSIVSRENLTDIDGNGDYERTTSHTVTITSKIDVTCTTGTRTLLFKISVKDTNNHDPAFLQSTYKYTLPMPMSPKTNITNFGTDILVRDIDFSNKEINFSWNCDGLTQMVTLLDNYTYQLQLQFTGLAKLKSSTQFSLTATDSGTPTRNSTATVIFDIDEENSEPPSFTKSSYLFDYDQEKSNIVARSGQEVMLEGERTGLKCDIKEEGSEEEYSTFFNDVIVNGQNIELSMKKPFTEDIIEEGIAQMTVECYVSKDIGVSSADVIISFPQNTEENVSFSEKKYNGTYEIVENKPVIKMAETITLTKEVDDVSISVEKSFSEFLEVKKTDGVWVLSAKKNFDKSILTNTEITVIIDLVKNSDQKSIDEAFVTLLLPNGEKGVYFEESFFSGEYQYDDNDDGTMQPIAIKLNSDDVDNVECGLQKSEYSEYFSPTCDTADEILLEMKSSLPKDLLKAETVPLSLWIAFNLGKIERNIKTAILLNLSYKGSTPLTTDKTTTTTHPTPSSQSSGDCSHTAWIIAVIVMLLLFVGYVIATVLYYFKRIRNSNEIDYVPTRAPKFDSRASGVSRTSDDKKFKNVSTRRPTGFIRFNPDQDGSSIGSEDGDTRNEVNNNTNANRFLNDPDETYRKSSDGSNSNRRNIGFAIPPPPPEPLTLSDELKRAVEERGSRLSN